MSSQKAKTYVDKNRYERYSDTHRLVHRDVAYYQIYKKNRHFYPLRFRVYQVHHRDGNKRNNSILNLQIVTRKEHERIHDPLKDVTGLLLKLLLFLFLIGMLAFAVVLLSVR